MPWYLWLYSLVAVIGSVISFSYHSELEILDKYPPYFAGFVLWPLTLIALVFVGLWRMLPERRSGLTRRQQRKIEYREALLAIEKAENDEHERAVRILNTKTPLGV